MPVRLACLSLLMVAAVAASLFAQETLPASIPASQPASQPTSQPASSASCLDEAKRFVESSGAYLYHDKVQRGMKGYGLTVMSGMTMSRFDVEIISVMENWGPQQAVILARLTSKEVGGVDLSVSGLIAGMSGSPVYIRDPRDGKDKLIGAVAYGWSAAKEPLCGIQPISQMIAVGGFLAQPTTQQAGLQKVQTAQAQAGRGARRGETAKILAAVLDPDKKDFSSLLLPSPQAGDDSAGLSAMVTPVMVSGASASVLREMQRTLGPLGLAPMQAGGAGQADLTGAKFAPGSSIAVILADGDVDMTAVGTVTEVRDGCVLAFGHPLFSEGEVSLPISPAYVHMVIPTLTRSFKLASGSRPNGTLTGDENTAISGRIGPVPAMTPMTVTITSPDEGRKFVYNFRIARHKLLSAVVARMLLMNAVSAWRELPEHHTISYDVDVDLGKLGHCRCSNISSDGDVSAVLADMTRPMAAVLANPFSAPADIERIDVRMEISPVSKSAEILDLRLDGATYEPGQTVKGVVAVREFRKDRTEIPISFRLPENLPDGEYALSANGRAEMFKQLQKEAPHRFEPESLEELLDTVRLVVQPRADRLYLRLPLETGGLAIGRDELNDLPASKARVIAQADSLDAKSFHGSASSELAVPYDLTGSAQAGLTVRNVVEKTPLRAADAEEGTK